MNDITLIDEREDLEDKLMSSRYWVSEIQAASKREKKWREEIVPKIEKKYRDERNLNRRVDKTFNILWSNTEVMKSALYPSTAQPDVRRRFGTSDPLGRQGALVLERGLMYCNDDYDIDGTVDRTLEDMLLAGRGVIWNVIKTKMAEDEEGEEYIADQTLESEYVHWRHYREGSAYTWRKMPWVARMHQWTKSEMKKGFPDHAEKLSYTGTTNPDETPGDESTEVFKRVDVWEIWDKIQKQRIYLVEDYPYLLKTEEDPYGLKDFFPCPEPCAKVRSNKNRIPLAEPTLYWDQIEELDRITTRIIKLTDTLKWRGVYDASSGEESDQLADLPKKDDGTFLPWKNFSELLEKGGLVNAFQALPITEVQAVINGLGEQRNATVQVIYQLTGISDIQRGSTDPRETKGAQQLKAQFGSIRMRKTQAEVERFVKDDYRIKAELIAEHFSLEKLKEMTGLDMPHAEDIQAEIQGLMAEAAKVAQQVMSAVQQAEMQGQQPPEDLDQMIEKGKQAVLDKIQELENEITWEKVHEFLRDDKSRGYKIAVESDNSVLQDADAEKKNRMEFMEVVSSMFERTVPAMISFPASIPLVKESFMFVVRGFKVGRVLEDAIEDAFDDISENPPPPQDNGEAKVAEAKVAMDRELTQMKLAEANAKIEMMREEFNLKFQQAQLDAEVKQMEAASDIQIEEAKAQADIDRSNQKLNADLTRDEYQARQKANIEAHKAQASIEIQAEKARQSNIGGSNV